MPRYEYVCSRCDHREDQVRTVAARDEVRQCTACAPERELLKAAGVAPMPAYMRRDAVASMQPHTDTGYQSPLLSNSAGINPEQIPEMRRRFPHHEFHPDGRMIFNSHAHRERCLRDIGMYDRN